MLKCYLSAESPNKQCATVNIQVRLAVKPLHISNSEYMHQYQIMNKDRTQNQDENSCVWWGYITSIPLTPTLKSILYRQLLNIFPGEWHQIYSLQVNAPNIDFFNFPTSYVSWQYQTYVHVRLLYFTFHQLSLHGLQFCTYQV